MDTSFMYSPIHPGEILLEEFLKPLNISQNQLARAMRVPPERINTIANGKRGITADTALRLSRFFGNSPHFWMNLQAKYDLDLAQMQFEDLIHREVIPLVEK